MASPILAELAQNLKNLRCRRGMTSQEAATACGFSRSVYSRIEAGKKKVVTLTQLEAIVRGMETTYDLLLGRYAVRLSPEVQAYAALLEHLPQPARTRILKLLQAGAAAPQEEVQAALLLLSRQQPAESQAPGERS